MNNDQPKIEDAEVITEAVPTPAGSPVDPVNIEVSPTIGQIPVVSDEIPSPSVSTQPVMTPEPTTEEEIEVEPDVIVVRTEETGDKVYAVRKQERRYWVKNPETLKKMGFYLGQEKKVPFSELLKFPEGDPLDLTPPGAVLPWDRPEGEKPAETKPANIWL